MTTKTVEQLELEIKNLQNALAISKTEFENLQQKRAETMQISSVQVFLENDPKEPKIRGFARCILNEQFQIAGLRIISGASGLFVSYPNDSTRKGRHDYQSVMYPITRELREEIEKAILQRYEQLIEQ